MMNTQTLQSITDSLQPLFAAVFLYHALVVRRMARVEPSVSYSCIVPMSLAAAAYYFFWQSYRLTEDAHLLRIFAHLTWTCGAVMVYFHIGALQAYFQPCSHWISRIRIIIACLLIPVTSSLLLLITTGKMFFLSPNPMQHPPLAFAEGVRDRIQHAFSGNAVIDTAGAMFIVIEVICFSYFLYLLVKRRGDRWLMLGMILMLLSIINDVIATMRLEEYSVSFLFVAIFVEIVRLTVLTEKANRERLLSIQNSMRLAQIGEMTATVAHELVNPLTIIIGNTDLALKIESLDAAKLRKTLERIQAAAARMLTIVRGLRDHARLEETENEPIHLEQTLTEISEMIRPMYANERVSLQLDIAPELPLITGNKGKLQQVLLNLLQNACDATEGKSDRAIRLSATFREGLVQVCVSDNGCGIPHEHLTKVFAPFFTTKPRGKGTGIGLAFVESQVRMMNGQVRVSSQPGKTEFTLLFPAGAI